MKISEIPAISNILIKIGTYPNIDVDYRISAIDLLKKLKNFENTVIEARQPIIDRYAMKNKAGKFVTIDVPTQNGVRKEYTFERELRSLYEIEIKKMMDFDFFEIPLRLFNVEKLKTFLSKQEIDILLDARLVIPGGVN